MIPKCCLALLLLAATASVHADVTVLISIRDNVIYAENGGRSNGAGEHLFAGRNGMNQTRRGLLAFDVAAIPAGSTITTVSLSMYCSKASPGSAPQAIGLYPLLKSWGEAGSDGGLEEGQGGPAQTLDVTWTQRYFGLSMPWAVAGGEFVATSSASSVVGGAGFFYSWSSPGMVADVQGWLDAQATNHGWILRGNEVSQTTVRRFGSRQNGFEGFWPRLTVTFTPLAPAPGATPDGDEVPGVPLTVARTASSDLELSWGPSCVPSVDDYAVYEGPLGSFDEHEPITCSTGGGLTLTIPPPVRSVFWLIVPVDPQSNAEGSYGRRSDGAEIPPSAHACFPQAIADPMCPP